MHLKKSFSFLDRLHNLGHFRASCTATTSLWLFRTFIILKKVYNVFKIS